MGNAVMSMSTHACHVAFHSRLQGTTQLPPVSLPVSSQVASPDPFSSPSVCLDLHSLTAILQTSLSILQHMPKGARDHSARVLSEYLSTVCDAPTDLFCRSKVFMLVKCVLARPAMGY